MDKMSVEELLVIKKKCDDAYYNTGKSVMSDDDYDLIVERIKILSPDMVLGVGCKLRDTNIKAKLPFFMGSLEKIKKDEPKKLANWLSSNELNQYIVSNKLNGVSCLIKYTAGESMPRLYTRGDGVYGSDISYLADKIQNIPKTLKMKPNLAVRGEIIINFKTYTSKYISEFKTALSLVSGTVNSNTLRKTVYDLEFIAYEIVDEANNLSPSENMNILQFLKFKVVRYTICYKSDLTCENLAKILEDQRSSYEFEMDGIVVQSDIGYNRSNITPDGNPKYAFAFKMINETVKATVVNVEWNVSKWGILKPIVCVNPVMLSGARVEHASGRNGKFIQSNNIGKGSIVLLTRSGEVIPYVISIIKSTTAIMPTCKYTWNETQVDIIADDADANIIPLLVHFFVTLDIKRINDGIVTKLVNAGFNTIDKILNMSVQNFETVPGMKTKLAENTFHNIHSVLSSGSVKISSVMVASGIFGFGLGIKKAENLMLNIPYLFDDSRPVSVNVIEQVDGFSTATATKIMSNIPAFKHFWETIIKKHLAPQNQSLVVSQSQSQPKSKADIFSKKTFVFSKFRDADLKQFIEQFGGVVSDSVTKSTTYVIKPNNYYGPDTDKMIKARQYNILILTPNEIRKLIT